MKNYLLVFMLILLLLALTGTGLAAEINYDNFTIEPRLIKTGTPTDVTITVSDAVYGDGSVNEIQVIIGETVFTEKINNYNDQKTFTLPSQDNTGTLQITFNGQPVSLLHVIDASDMDNLVSFKVSDINGQILNVSNIYTDGEMQNPTLTPSGVLDLLLSNEEHTISFVKSDADDNLYFVKEKIAQQEDNNSEILVEIKGTELNKINFHPLVDDVGRQIFIYLTATDYLTIDLNQSRNYYFSNGDYKLKLEKDSSDYVIYYEDTITIDENNNEVDFNNLLGEVDFDFSNLPAGNIAGKYIIYNDKVIVADKTIYLKKEEQTFASIFVIYNIDNVKYKLILENYQIDLNTAVNTEFDWTFQELIIETIQDGEQVKFRPRIITMDGNKVDLTKQTGGTYKNLVLVELLDGNDNLLNANAAELLVDLQQIADNHKLRVTLEDNPIYGESILEAPTSSLLDSQGDTETLPELEKIEAFDATTLKVYLTNPYEGPLDNGDFKITQIMGENEQTFNFIDYAKNSNNMESILILDKPLTEGEFNLNDTSAIFTANDWFKADCSKAINGVYGVQDTTLKQGITVNGSVTNRFFLEPFDEIFIGF